MGCVVVKPNIENKENKERKTPRQLFITVSTVPKISCKYRFLLRKDLHTIFEAPESMESSKIYCFNEAITAE
ncbi:hypothetical protein SteCoe_34788 [Stentor coeruleus]|uniref:Uncharacterized protein n=1 Tax=Stentor coeruleus TaxID=5963 RepID=A0A1R2ATS3_9CILI|nr:hypothetical protein SteCoe_34788 [Stentor coeruleus]